MHLSITSDSEEEEKYDSPKKRKKKKNTAAETEQRGFPLFKYRWKTIQKIIYMSYICNVISLIIGVVILILSIRIQRNIGDFINMVTEGDGTIIPIILVISSVFPICINISVIIITRRLCSPSQKTSLNHALFGLIIFNILLVIIISALAIFNIVHAYSCLQHSLHDGIKDAMYNYHNNTKTKKRLDILQITFRCCGSKTYNEWFEVPWYDSNVCSSETESSTRDDAPFSCCATRTHYLCVHHSIMSVGAAYLYAPETNMSIAKNGCQTILLKTARSVATKVTIGLFVYAGILIVVGILGRLIQTGHSELYRFDVTNYHTHTLWIFGSRVPTKVPPTPPPYPPLYN